MSSSAARSPLPAAFLRAASGDSAAPLLKPFLEFGVELGRRSRRLRLGALLGLLLTTACAHAPPAPPSPPPPPEPQTVEEAALFEAVETADRLRCDAEQRLRVELRLASSGAMLSGLSLSLDPGERRVVSDRAGRADFGLLPAGEYRLSLDDPRYALIESRLSPGEADKPALLSLWAEAVGAGLPEITVHGRKWRWCGALGEVCGLPISGKERLNVVIDGFIRGLPH